MKIILLADLKEFRLFTITIGLSKQFLVYYRTMTYFLLLFLLLEGIEETLMINQPSALKATS